MLLCNSLLQYAYNITQTAMGNKVVAVFHACRSLKFASPFSFLMCGYSHDEQDYYNISCGCQNENQDLCSQVAYYMMHR